MNAWRRCNHFVQSLSRLETPHREIGPAFSCALWLKMSFSNVEMRMKSGFWIQTLGVLSRGHFSQRRLNPIFGPRSV